MSTFATLNSVPELDAVLRAVAQADEPGTLRVERGDLWIDYDLSIATTDLIAKLAPPTSLLSAKLATFSGALRAGRDDAQMYDLVGDRMVALELA